MSVREIFIGIYNPTSQRIFFFIIIIKCNQKPRKHPTRDSTAILMRVTVWNSNRKLSDFYKAKLSLVNIMKQVVKFIYHT